MITNLGKAIGIIIAADCTEMSMHADVSAWGAPSECHDDVRRGEEKRMRRAHKHAEAVAGRPWRIIVREARKRGFEFGGPKYDRAVARIYTNGKYFPC